MKIDKYMLESYSTELNGVEPDAELIQRKTEHYTKFFLGIKGMGETDISRKFIPLVARRRIDKENAIDHPDEFAEMRKGVALIGGVGTGKTMMLKLAACALQIEYIDVPSLSKTFSMHGAASFWSTVAPPNTGLKDLILDDLGAEADAKSFGNVVPIVDLMYERYNLWKNFGYKTWLASNLTGKDLEVRYGLRVVDRIREMCEIIPCVGNSLRR